MVYQYAKKSTDWLKQKSTPETGWFSEETTLQGLPLSNFPSSNSVNA
jgi:hypothetical protein